MDEKLLIRVDKCIERFQMLAPRERVVVGCSGGADSMCLFDALARGLPRLALSLVAVYVDHSLRSETRADQEAVASLARACGAEYVYTRVDVPARVRATGESVQEAARYLRYRELERVADEVGATRIAVGHTRTDQAETVLLQLIRGTGSRGLAGIAPVNGRVVRPLLDISREEARAYCLSRGIQFVDDPSNASDAYLRNRVRMELLPLLAGYNPGVEEHLARLADILREEEALLAGLVDEVAGKLFEPVHDGLVSQGTPVGVKVAGDQLLAEPRAIARRLIRRAYASVRGDERGLGFDHVERILAGAARRDGTWVIGCFGGIEVRNEYGSLLFLKREERVAAEQPVTKELQVPGETPVEALGVTVRASFERGDGDGAGLADVGQTLEERLGDVPLENLSARLDWERLKPPLIVRNRRPGDRLQPVGLEGSKKVKDILIDAKVPRRLRDRVPVIEDREGVIWVVGYALAERARASKNSREILRLIVDEA